jgi:hypothetical protein
MNLEMIVAEEVILEFVLYEIDSAAVLYPDFTSVK